MITAITIIIIDKAKEQRDKFNKVEEQDAISEAMNAKIVWSNTRHFDVEKVSSLLLPTITIIIIIITIIRILKLSILILLIEAFLLFV
jgi:hypothetical protein